MNIEDASPPFQELDSATSSWYGGLFLGDGKRPQLPTESS
jgi:hypothetical protein